jgi:hypothetical protein
MTVAIDKTPVPLHGDPLDPIWWRGKQWAVTKHGIEALDGSYAIPARRLAEDLPGYSWVDHMAEKDEWVDIDEFATAWLIALQLHGVTVSPTQIFVVLDRVF